MVVRADEIIRSVFSRAEAVRVRNALNPFLWSFVWSIAFLLAAYALRDDNTAKYGCLGAALIPMLVSLGMGMFFGFKHPDRLQSEEFLIRQQELTMIEKKGGFLLPPTESGNDQAMNNDQDHGVGEGPS